MTGSQQCDPAYVVSIIDQIATSGEGYQLTTNWILPIMTK